MGWNVWWVEMHYTQTSFFYKVAETGKCHKISQVGAVEKNAEAYGLKLPDLNFSDSESDSTEQSSGELERAYVFSFCPSMI